MKLFIFLVAINLNLTWQDSSTCNDIVKSGCVKTATSDLEDIDSKIKDVENNLEETTTVGTNTRKIKKAKSRKPKSARSLNKTDNKNSTGKPKNKGFIAHLVASGLHLKNEDKNKTLIHQIVSPIGDKVKEIGEKVGINTRKRTNKKKKNSNKTGNILTRMAKKISEKCFENIGCFSALEYASFDLSKRPVNLLPMSPKQIKPVFHLYTIDSETVPTNFSYNPTSEELKNSTFKPEHRTAIIVHGFKSGFEVWMEDLKDHIQDQSNGSFNIIVVVWEKGSKLPSYSLAATNTRVVGACIAHFIKQVCKTFNVTNDMFDMIGHSLGAHIAGYAGKRLKNPKIARIVALDPAGVFFHYKNGKKRLDSNDATIVSVIHTDGAHILTEGFGTTDTLGHFDFYPNGGIWQPGCPSSRTVIQKLGVITRGQDISCSHSMAFALINNLDKPGDDCRSVAYQCKSYEMFLEGRCADCRDHKCELMGIDINHWLTQEPTNHTIDKKYFINTSQKEDYCLQHYQFALHVADGSDSCSGILDFILKIELANESKEIEFDRTMTETVPNKTHTFLINFGYDIKNVFGLDLSWGNFSENEAPERVNRGTILLIPYIEINFMSSLNERFREQYSTVLCAKNPQLSAGETKTEYEECKSVKQLERAFNIESDKLVALEHIEDIHSVDDMRENEVYHKVKSSRISKDSFELDEDEIKEAELKDKLEQS